MPGTVTVACKLPNGLRLRLHRMVDASEQVMGGGSRTVKKAVPISEPVYLNGFARETHKPASHPIKGGYAFTFGVDADFMTEWMKQNAELHAVKNDLIIIHEKTAMVEGKAKEQRMLKSGLEPVDPDNLPKGIQPATKKAEED